MRLINTRIGKFVSVRDPRTVHYATLSHVWSKPDNPDFVQEQTYQDVCHILANRGNTLNPSSLGEYPNPSFPGDYPSPVEVPVSGSAISPPSPDPEGSILPQLSEKIRRFCEVALADGFELAWADTCCIDQTNPSELAEAITSMYDWYSYSKACYVFLPDVSDRGHGRAGDARPEEHWETEFRRSQWFKRQWTLQELLAPNVVIFLSKNWNLLGSKHGLASLIEDITTIERAVIKCEKPLDAVSVACRMSWAALRETTREEDRAYSMLGIFGVNIRIVYGEGSYAFYRLQEAIINEIPDQTIFAWQLCLSQESLTYATFSRPSDEHPSGSAPTNKQLPNLPINALCNPWQYLLANSPDDFAGSSDLVPLSREESVKTLGVAPADAIQIFKSTAYGISARLPLVGVTLSSVPSHPTIYLALLACRFGNSRTLVALLLHPHDNAPSPQAGWQYVVGTMPGRHSDAPLTPSDPHSPLSSIDRSYVRATVLTPTQLQECRETFRQVEVLIANRPSRAQHRLERDIPLYRDLASKNEAFQVQLCGWSSRLLEQQGYTTSMRDCPNSVITLSPGVFLQDVAMDFVIGRGDRAHAPRIEIEVGRLCTSDVQALGVTVQSSGEMQVVDGYSGRTDTHHSHISSWNRHGGAAMKELGLIFFHGEQLTLRLVLTHEPGGPSRGTAGGASVYRLGAEIFGTESHFQASSSAFPLGSAARPLPVASTMPRQSGRNGHTPATADRRRRNVTSPRR